MPTIVYNFNELHGALNVKVKYESGKEVCRSDWNTRYPLFHWHGPLLLSASHMIMNLICKELIFNSKKANHNYLEFQKSFLLNQCVFNYIFLQIIISLFDQYCTRIRIKFGFRSLHS